jgi:hypothetical protein
LPLPLAELPPPSTAGAYASMPYPALLDATLFLIVPKFAHSPAVRGRPVGSVYPLGANPLSRKRLPETVGASARGGSQSGLIRAIPDDPFDLKVLSTIPCPSRCCVIPVILNPRPLSLNELLAMVTPYMSSDTSAATPLSENPFAVSAMPHE